MAEIPLQTLGATGTELTEGAAAAGDTAQVGPNKFLSVRNGSGAPITVTIAVPGTDFTGAATPDMVQTVAAGKIKIFPPAGRLWRSSSGRAGLGHLLVHHDGHPIRLRHVLTRKDIP